MRDLWYGDKRDLLKWGVLLQLARLHRAESILQIAYYRPTSWGLIEVDSQQYPIPSAVINHFRNIRNAVKLTTQPRIYVVTSVFRNRKHYMEEIIRAIASLPKLRCIVFLDPDTGLEPSKPDFKHTVESELAGIWSRMQKGDVLVFYQHRTNRNGTPWIKPKLSQFERALGLPPGMTKLARGPALASDVVFFYVQKPKNGQPRRGAAM